MIIRIIINKQEKIDNIQKQQFMESNKLEMDQDDDADDHKQENDDSDDDHKQQERIHNTHNGRNMSRKKKRS